MKQVFSWSRYLALTQAFAWADFRLRFHGSALGILWSFIRPLLIFGVLFVVFSLFIRFDIPNYALYLLLGVILWNFFSEATLFSLASIEGKAPLIKKVPFPRTIIVISAVTTSFISLCFNLIVFFVFFAFSGISLTLPALLLFVYISLLFVATCGVGFMLTALFSKARDVRAIWEVFLQLGFWVTPIIYSVSMAPQKFHFYIYLNPMTRVIEYSREAVLEGLVSDLNGVFTLFLMSLVIFLVGFFVFAKMSRNFAEDL